MINQKTLATSVSSLFPLVLAIYEVIIYLSNDAYLPALTHISQDFQATHQLIQLTLTAWFVGSASMQLLIGPLADRFGRRPILLFGGLCFIIVTLGCSLADNISLFIVLRFLQGATVTSMVVAGYATIHELFEDTKAIHIIAIMTSIVILAPAFGPLLGAIILYGFSWRWIFGILAILAVLTILYLFFEMPETKEPALSDRRLHQIFRSYLKIFSNKSFMLHIFISQIFFGMMVAWITAGPFLLIDRFSLSPMQFSLFQVLIFGCFILASRSVKKLIESYPLNNIIRFCTMLSLLAGMGALTLSLAFHETFWVSISAMVILAVAVGFGLPILNRLAIQSSEESMGTKVAVWSCAISLSAAIYSAFLSVLGAYFGPYLALSITLFVSSLIAFLSYHTFTILNKK